jgi:predicted ferric reductase
MLILGVPLILYMAGDLPKRTLLKETISLLTLLSFTVTIGQFFLSRCNNMFFRDYTWPRIIKVHKVLGYIVLLVLLLHPVLLVVPRNFEAGIGAGDAFIAIVTNVHSTGVVTGICAWILLLLLGITSLFREKLFVHYPKWRKIHGILSVLFLITASWHAIDLGRHLSSIFSAYIVTAVTVGALLFVKHSLCGWRAKVASEVVI